MKLPTNWQTGSLGKLCSIEIGGTPSRNISAYWDLENSFGNFWVSIKDLNQSIICRTAEQITELGIKHSNVKLQTPGTILLSFKLSIGRVAVAGTPLYTNEAIAGLRSEAIDHEFLFQGLQQWDLLQDVDQAIKGATLNKEKLRKIEFRYPVDKAEQAKIAHILSTVDRAIEQTEALIAKQQRIKTGLMQDLLTRGIDEHGNLRSEETHQFKDSPLGRIPVEWNVVPFSFFVNSLVAGISVNSEDRPCGPGELGVLKTSALFEGTFSPEENKTVLNSEISRASCTIQQNTILISRMNTPELVGESGYVAFDHPNLVLPDRIWMTVFATDMEDYAKWLSYVLTSTESRRFISLHATGTSGSMKNLSKTSLMSMKCKAPISKREYRQITQVLDNYAETLKSYYLQLQKLQAIKMGLMQDLLTGRKRVTALLEHKELVNA